MLLKKLFRTMWQYKAQFISMIIMITLGVGVFVGFNAEWFTLQRNTQDFMRETGFADYRIVDENGLTQADADKIAALDGVDEVALYFAANLKQGQHTLSTTVTTNPKVSLFVVIEGAEYDPEDEKGIWVSYQYAQKNNIEVGDDLQLELQGFKLDATVRGLVKSGEYMICVIDDTQIMPNHENYGFAYVSPAYYNKVAFVGGRYYQINVLSSLDKDGFTQKVNDALGKTMLVLGKDESYSYSGTQGEIEEGQTMSTVLPVMFLAIAVLTMVTTMHRLTAKEKTQIGTLKALGFKDRRISVHYTSYAFSIGVIGIVLGVILGFGVAYIIVNPDGMMSSYIDIPQWTIYVPAMCYIVLAVMLAALTLVGFLSVRKMLKGSAAESLQPYQPKKMRKLLVERGKLWNKLGFAAQWNIRDVFRHKARSLMSLIGIVGCMILLVGGFGMKDTLNKFIDVNYNQAMSYNTRVFIDETATAAQRQAIVDSMPDGDWSATVSVEVGSKAVGLNVYGLGNGRLHFVDDNGKIVELGTDGAYLCRRVADDNNKKVGDTIEVKPYGKNVVYKMKVVGIVSSMTESVVVTSDYADSIGVEYKIDSVYTNLAESDVPVNDKIKSKQIKSEITDSFDSMMELMNTSVAVLVLGALVLELVVLYNLGVMSYTERYREMATLKVVGFKDAAIGRLLVGQNMWLTLVGIVIGLPAGVFTLQYLVDALASEYELTVFLGPVTYIVGIALTFVVSLAVSLLVARKNKNIDMVESLKMAD